jgi:putative nucleotidyltransferase with HDIG domain
MNSKFVTYLDPAVPLKTRLEIAYGELQISAAQIEQIHIFTGVLELKDKATYEHSVRVALLARQIARFMHLDQTALLYAGLLHDVGKAQTNPATLKKTIGWTAEDTAEVMKHVMDGYRLIRGTFDFSAEVILWHHRFQPNSYPQESPEPLHEYSTGTKVLIPFFGRALALADQFDALHRVNDKFSEGSSSGSIGEIIKERMLEHNVDQRSLILELYEEGIFTTETWDT